jgi:hypothetical protein
LRRRYEWSQIENVRKLQKSENTESNRSPVQKKNRAAGLKPKVRADTKAKMKDNHGDTIDAKRCIGSNTSVPIPLRMRRLFLQRKIKLKRNSKNSIYTVTHEEKMEGSVSSSGSRALQVVRQELVQ